MYLSYLTQVIILRVICLHAQPTIFYINPFRLVEAVISSFSLLSEYLPTTMLQSCNVVMLQSCKVVMLQCRNVATSTLQATLFATMRAILLVLSVTLNQVITHGPTHRSTDRRASLASVAAKNQEGLHHPPLFMAQATAVQFTRKRFSQKVDFFSTFYTGQCVKIPTKQFPGTLPVCKIKNACQRV